MPKYKVSLAKNNTVLTRIQILQGSLKETRYAWPERKRETSDGQRSPLRLEKETVFAENEVTYMSDEVCIA